MMGAMIALYGLILGPIVAALWPTDPDWRGGVVTLVFLAAVMILGWMLTHGGGWLVAPAILIVWVIGAIRQHRRYVARREVGQ
jgi:hypothetical protein